MTNTNVAVTKPQTVYEAIAKVQAELAKEGISKERSTTQGATFKFRGIDDIYNALATLLATHGLCILPRIIGREQVRRDRGGDKEPLYFVVVKAEYDFISAHDGSKHTVEVWGEAMDSGGKATNKAMSAAYKYACLQTFCIPTESDPAAEEEKLRKQQEEIDKQVRDLEKEILLAIDKVDSAASYATAREAVIPVILRLKQLALSTATKYEQKMQDLKAQYVTKRPTTVEGAMGAKP